MPHGPRRERRVTVGPMIEVLRTDSHDPRFRALVAELDADLWRRYGNLQAAYAPHNLIETLATVIVALDGGRPVGCGCFKPFGAGTVELKRMYVAPDARGRGIAGQVVAALEQWARELGFTAIALETGTKQHEAIALYTKLGFAPIDRFGPYVDLPLSVCMRKSLT